MLLCFLAPFVMATGTNSTRTACSSARCCHHYPDTQQHVVLDLDSTAERLLRVSFL